jgi:hypothetical protein
MFVPLEDGRWVNENFARLAEVINAYDYNLKLMWIPPDKRDVLDKKPYAVIDIRTNSYVLYATELDTPVDILARLYAADNTKGNVLSKLEAHNKSIESIEVQRRIEHLEELREYAYFLLASRKNFLRANGKKFDSERRVISDRIRYL